MNNNKAHRAHPVAIAVLATLIAEMAVAADISVTAPITKVKAYRAQASITRQASLSLPAGVHLLKVESLPSTLDPKTVQISIDDPSVRLGAVAIEEVNRAELVSPAERGLKDRLQSLEDRKAALLDEIATAELQVKLLDSIAARPSDGPGKPAVASESLELALKTIQNGGGSAKARIRDARIRLRTLDDEIKSVTADLKKVATERKTTTTATIAAESSRQTAVVLSVQYVLEEAGWQWIYQARLDSETQRVALTRQAALEQSTGEDWRDIELTLTTAVPADNAAPPEIGPLVVSLEPPETRRSMGSGTVDEIIVTTRKREEVGARITEYVADYRVPGRVTILADRDPRLFPLASSDFKVDLVARVVPNLNAVAYLTAALTYSGDEPFQAGSLQLYRDGAYVGSATTRGFQSGQDVRIPFGADERVQVAVQTDAAESRSAGFINRQRVDESRQRFEITSFHKGPIRVEVLDRIPVSQEADVRIEAIKGATKPSLTDVDGKSGVWQWNIDAQPKVKNTIRHYWSVQYPRDRDLTLEDQSEDPEDLSDR